MQIDKDLSANAIAMAVMEHQMSGRTHYRSGRTRWTMGWGEKHFEIEINDTLLLCDFESVIRNEFQ